VRYPDPVQSSPSVFNATYSPISSAKTSSLP
jgi:hypothetical protein